MSSARLYFSDKPVGIDITDENEIARCSERIFGFSDISDKTARLKEAFESVSSDRADVIVRAVPDICGVAEIHAYNDLRRALFSKKIKKHALNVTLTRFEADEPILYARDFDDPDAVEKIFADFTDSGTLPDFSGWNML